MAQLGQHIEYDSSGPDQQFATIVRQLKVLYQLVRERIQVCLVAQIKLALVLQRSVEQFYVQAHRRPDTFPVGYLNGTGSF